MNLNQQVCSLELARKLKELGVKQESYFWWAIGNGWGGWKKDSVHLLKCCSNGAMEPL
jgi:hypothetical protein